MSDLVLDNADLLREIFKHLESAPKRQLLATALTCRGFSSPALDCLWKKMHCIIPFLKLLPSFQTVNGFPKSIFTLKAILDYKPLSSYAIFQAYAVRVQEFSFTENAATNAIPSMTILRLTQLKGDGPLFPALRHVHYASASAVREEVMLLMESPLKGLYFLDYTPKDTHFPAILSMLPGLQNTLTHFILTATTRENLGPDELKAIASLTELRWLHLVVPAKNKPFGSLSKLQRLERLELTASEEFITHVLLNLPSTHIRHLGLARRDCTPWTTAFLDRADQCQAPSFWHQCAEIVQDKWRDTLQAFRIQDQFRLDPFTRFEFQSFIRNLYPIQGLEFLEIHNVSTLSVVITDIDYMDIATSFRGLKHLHLHLPTIPPNINQPFTTPSPGWGPFQPNAEEFTIPKSPTANALLILAQSCPLLETLQIYLPSTKFEGVSGQLVLPDGFTGHSNLRKLWLGNCEVDDAITIATRLNLLFPSLQTAAGVIATPGFNVVAHAGSACGFEWMSVQRWIQTIKDIRAAERARISAILDEAGVKIPGGAQRKIYSS